MVAPIRGIYLHFLKNVTIYYIGTFDKKNIFEQHYRLFCCVVIFLHITLASLKVMTSDVMTDLDREVIIHACKKFRSWIEAVMEATGVFIK